VLYSKVVDELEELLSGELDSGGVVHGVEGPVLSFEEFVLDD